MVDMRQETVCSSTDVDESQEIVYMTGNSLGLQPKSAKEYVNCEMDKWARRWDDYEWFRWTSGPEGETTMNDLDGQVGQKVRRLWMI